MKLYKKNNTLNWVLLVDQTLAPSGRIKKKLLYECEIITIIKKDQNQRYISNSTYNRKEFTVHILYYGRLTLINK